MPIVEVVHQPEQHRFVALIDGRVVGETVYLRRGTQNIFVHTETDSAFAGQGLATQLIGEALAATRAEDNRIVALCPFVRSFVTKHHEFDDIVDALPARAPSQSQASELGVDRG